MESLLPEDQRIVEDRIMTTATERYAVIVDPYSSGSLFANEFAQLGCKVIAVLSSVEPPDVYAASYRPADFAFVRVACAADLAPLVNELRHYKPFCVLTGCESGVELAEQLAPLLIPEFSNAVELAPARRDKGLMAQAAINAGVTMMKQICTDDFSHVKNWVFESGLAGKSLVVKPPKSASTDGVSKIYAGVGLENAFFGLLDKPNRLGIINDRVLVQEYLSGTEYVVDTFSHAGIHTVCSVCKYTKLESTHGMAIYDRMDWVSADQAVIEPLAAYAEQVLNALGMFWGNAHIEIMLTSDGPRLIELGARPHGGGHPRLCFMATGDSQVHRSVKFFAGGVVPSTRYNLLKHMTVVFFRALTPSVARNVSRLHALAALSSYVDASIQIKEHQTVPATQDLFATLALGFVVLAHPDPLQLERDIVAVRQAESSVFQECAQGVA
ncbi:MULTISPECIES: ATP-grasp domain-containing protein [unclassified Pseudomonas]|uniref:ATP-grasp domain-containing protein n=1 Tax=unclassified Pseudomonas TaxID=196821 RepID=UPI002B23DA78|nr:MULTISPECIES: ATP-grasp domain-containing protein [unclassified Pseudomonas]MEA9977994.1 ATP-grasp domain-containing protein [Pseudomonas sp. RTS4]MEB0198499.1 ATP-grasp domain-containing protein [Pseudomonas sp. 5S4]MEB0246002.1 ATP-grasp domain-containing protein [Pseudomonas sp. 10S5]